MKLKLYAVLDTCSGVYDGPVGNHNDESAVRAFGDILAREGSPINLHPEHFILFRVGEWDDATGTVKEIVPAALCKAIDLVHKDENDA